MKGIKKWLTDRLSERFETNFAVRDGTFEFVLRDEKDEVTLVRSARNFITNAGKEHIADRLSDLDQSAMSHMAVGTGSGQTVASTTLAAESARVALSSGYPDQGTGDEVTVIIWQAVFGAGVGTGTITEVGVLNASSGGVLFNYTSSFVPILKGAGNSLTITLKARVAA